MDLYLQKPKYTIDEVLTLIDLIAKRVNIGKTKKIRVYRDKMKHLETPIYKKVLYVVKAEEKTEEK